MGLGVILQATATDDRVANPQSGFLRQERHHRAIGEHWTRLPGGGQQHRAAVEVEAPGEPWVEAAGFEHAHQSAGRVVREVPVPESVPLAQADDRVQRVVLQQEGAAGGHPGGPLRQGRRTGPASCIMPKESMTRSAGPPSATGARPRSARRPATSLHGGWELGDPASAGEPPRRRRRSTASTAWATSASGSAPRGSSATVGSPTSWARPHDEHSHISSG